MKLHVVIDPIALVMSTLKTDVDAPMDVHDSAGELRLNDLISCNACREKRLNLIDGHLKIS